MTPLIKVWNVGKVSYKTGLRLQEVFAKKHVNEKGSSNVMLLLEHNPVYTVGIRDKSYTLSEEKRLKHLGADFYRTNRGGLITFHGPGQLIAYPILNLKDFNLTMRSYVGNLEKTVKDICSNIGLNAYTCEHTGVWINNRKVCAIGVHGSRFITTHGLALNCSSEVLHWFDYIVPCGVEGKGVTCLMQEMNKNYSVNDAAAAMIKSFCKTFKCDNIDFPESEADFLTNSLLEFDEGKSRAHQVTE